jgi:hypothetical protein
MSAPSSDGMTDRTKPPLQENANKYSWLHSSQRTRAKTLAKSPHCMNLSTTSGITPRNTP